MSNHIADNTLAIEVVAKTYPDITEEQREYIAAAALSAAETLIEGGMISAVENAREDDFDADTDSIKEMYSIEALTNESTYKIVRDGARIVMATWNVASKYDADSFGYHFVMTRNEEGVGFWDEARFPEGGKYLDMYAKRYMVWHVDADENGVNVYAA